LLSLFLELGFFVTLVFDNYQVMNLASGLNARMSTRKKDLVGGFYAHTLIDSLLRIAELEPDPLHPTAKKSTLRSSNIKSLLALLNDFPAELNKEMLPGNSDKATATLKLIQMTGRLMEVVEASSEEEGDEEGEEETNHSSTSSESEDLDASSESEDLDASSELEDSDATSESEEDSEVSSCATSSEESEDSEDEEENQGEQYERLIRFNTLKEEDQIEIQHPPDILFYRYTLKVKKTRKNGEVYWEIEYKDDQNNVQEYDLDVDDNWRHCVVQPGQVGSPGVQQQQQNNTDNNVFLFPQNGPSWEERLAQTRKEFNEFMEAHPEKRKVSGKTTDWKNIVGLFARFSNSSRIEEVAQCIFEYILMLGSVDPNRTRMWVLVADAQTYNFVRHILNRARHLYPDLDFGYIFLAPELWHATQSGMMAHLTSQKKSVLYNVLMRLVFYETQDIRDIQAGRFSLKHKTFQQLHGFVIALYEAWMIEKPYLLNKYSPDKVEGNMDLEALISVLDFCLPSIIHFLANLTTDTGESHDGIRDLFQMLYMGNATTYTSIMLKFKCDLLHLQKYEPNFYRYVMEQLASIVGVCIEHQHAKLAHMHNPKSSPSDDGFSSPDSQIGRIDILDAIDAFYEKKYPSEFNEGKKKVTYKLAPNNDERTILCQEVLFDFFDAAHRHKTISLSTPRGCSSVCEPANPHSYALKISFAVNQPTPGFCISCVG